MEQGERQQVEEVYTIKQVVEMTGVPDNTIRSWERRFGIPRPGRSETNQRRYSRSDVEAIRSIQASRDHGRTMEQAILDQRSMSPLTIPALDQISTAGDHATAANPNNNGSVDSLVDALVDLDTISAARVMDDASWTSSIADVCFELLLEAHETIDRQHAEGAVSALQQRFAQDWIMRKLIAAFDLSHPESGQTDIVVAAMHDATAQVDSLCLSIALSRAGFSVSWNGGEVSLDDVHVLVEKLSPAAVVLVANSGLSRIASEAAAIALASDRNPDGWHGVVAVCGIDQDLPPGTIHIELDADLAPSVLGQALQSQASNIRFMRRE